MNIDIVSDLKDYQCNGIIHIKTNKLGFPTGNCQMLPF